MCDKDKILTTYIHAVNLSSELHGERRDSVEMAAALCIQQRETDGGKDFGFAVYFFFFQKTAQ